MGYWNSTDCAAFFRCTRKHFMERIRPLPSFPRAMRMPTMVGLSRPLWTIADVQTWAESNLRARRAA